MEALIAKIFLPFVLLFGVWCGKEDGVLVKYEIRGQPVEKRLNVVCEKPDLRMPVFGGRDERD